MSLTGIALAKSIIAGLGITAAVGGVAVATGNVHGLTIALQHVPGWTHAHSVLQNLTKG